MTDAELSAAYWRRMRGIDAVVPIIHPRLYEDTEYDAYHTPLLVTTLEPHSRVCDMGLFPACLRPTMHQFWHRVWAYRHGWHEPPPACSARVRGVSPQRALVPR